MDVEIEDVEREVVRAVDRGDLLDHRVRVIAIAALLVAEGPERRQRHAASEFGVAAEDLLQRGTVEEIVIQNTALGGIAGGVLAGVAEVKGGAVGVVVEEAVGAAVFHAEVERNALVDRVRALDVTGRVGIPHREPAAPAVEAGGLFAQTVKVFIEAELFRRGDAAGRGIAAHGALVGVDDATGGGVAKCDQERVALDDDFQFTRGQGKGTGLFGELPRRRAPFGARDRPRVVGHGGLADKERSHADKIRRENRDGDGGAVGAGESHVLLGADDFLDGTHRLEAVPVEGHRGAAEDQDANGGDKTT